MNRKNKRKKKRISKGFKFLMIGMIVLGIVAVLVVCLTQNDSSNSANSTSQNDSSNTVNNTEESSSTQIDTLQEISINLGNGMRITEIGNYTGIYMEDGSDEVVSGILMIAVTNEGEHAIQYAEIIMPVGDEEAFFKMSTLTPGSTVVLLEQNRMEYTDGEYTTALAENVAIFQEPLSLCEDELKFQILDGGINVTNISGQDINGDITIYYKNSAVDVYYGGITYRVRIEGGLKKGEIRQIMADHFSESGSTIMFATYGEQ